jgi:hypothetical protein
LGDRLFDIGLRDFEFFVNSILPIDHGQEGMLLDIICVSLACSQSLQWVPVQKLQIESFRVGKTYSYQHASSFFGKEVRQLEGPILNVLV